MSSYHQAVLAMLIAMGAHVIIIVIALRAFMRQTLPLSRRIGWAAMTLTALLLSVQQARTLEMALATGLYDQTGALHAAVAALCLSLSALVLRPAA